MAKMSKPKKSRYERKKARKKLIKGLTGKRR
jgi:hypothetical protein